MRTIPSEHALSELYPDVSKSKATTFPAISAPRNTNTCPLCGKTAKRAEKRIDRGVIIRKKKKKEKIKTMRIA